jgi:hypothetical protein
MINRILDADAFEKLLEWLENEIAMDSNVYKINLENMIVKQAFLESTIYNKKLFLQKINELATPAPEPQESIFDADGWCWDMDLTPDSENVIFYITNLDLKIKRASTGMKIGKEFYFPMVSEKDKPIAWRPLPTLPTGGNNDK